MRVEFANRAFRLGYSYSFYLLFMELSMMVMKNPMVSWLSMLVLLGIYVLNYLVRDRVLRIWPLALINAAVGALCWLLPEITLQKLLLSGACFGLFLSGSGFVMQNGRYRPMQDVPWPAFLLGVVATIAGITNHIPRLVVLSMILTLLTVVFYLLIIYTDGIRKYIESTRDVSGIPMQRIVKINSWIVACIIVGMLVMILLGELLNLPDAFTRLGEALLDLVRIFALGVGLFFKWIARLFQSGDGKEELTDERQFLRKEIAGNRTMPELMTVVLKLLILALVLYVLVRIFARIFRFLVAKYQKDTPQQVVEITKKDQKVRLKRGHIFDRAKTYLSMEERARRIYKKRVLEYRKKSHPSDTETVQDICEGLRQDEGVSMRELTALYEAIRYGNVVPDRAYLSRMKKADRK